VCVMFLSFYPFGYCLSKGKEAKTKEKEHSTETDQMVRVTRRKIT